MSRIITHRNQNAQRFKKVPQYRTMYAAPSNLRQMRRGENVYKINKWLRMQSGDDNSKTAAAGMVKDSSRTVVKEAAPFWKRLLITFLTAILSGVVPGLGQMLNRQWVKAVVMFVVAVVLWFTMLGWLVHFFAYVDAASWAWQRTGRQYEA